MINPHVITELLQSFAAIAVGGRLIYFGLAKQVPALLSYLAYIAASYFCFGVANRTSLLYFWLYIAFMPIECLLGVLAVRELFSLLFDRFPGIRTVGRWAMYAGIAISAGTSLTITKFLWNTGATGRIKWGIYYTEVAQRSIVFSLAVAIIAIVFVLSKYPLNLSRNTYVSCGFFCALFLSDAARLFIDGLAQASFNNYADWGESVLIAFCLVGWAALLRPETAPVARMAFKDEQEERLLQQLNSLNDLMSRAAR